MKQPKDLVELDKEGHGCLLKKALHGLKQVSREWYENLNKDLSEMSFKRSKGEP